VVKPTGGYLLKPITVIISCLNLEVTVKATQGPHTSHLSVEQKEERPTHHCAFLLLTLLSLWNDTGLGQVTCHRCNFSMCFHRWKVLSFCWLFFHLLWLFFLPSWPRVLLLNSQHQTIYTGFVKDYSQITFMPYLGLLGFKWRVP